MPKRPDHARQSTGRSLSCEDADTHDQVVELEAGHRLRAGDLDGEGAVSVSPASLLMATVGEGVADRTRRLGAAIGIGPQNRRCGSTCAVSTGGQFECRLTPVISWSSERVRRDGDMQNMAVSFLAQVRTSTPLPRASREGNSGMWVWVGRVRPVVQRVIGRLPMECRAPGCGSRWARPRALALAIVRAGGEDPVERGRVGAGAVRKYRQDRHPLLRPIPQQRMAGFIAWARQSRRGVRFRRGIRPRT